MEYHDDPNVNESTGPAGRPFSIIEEFAVLSTKRKILLCDYLFVEGRQTFQNTVHLLWPEASALDIKKLESFLVVLKNAVPGH